MAFTGLLRYNYIRNETAAQAGDGNAFCIRRNGTCLIWVNKDEQLCVVISCIGHIVRAADSGVFSFVIRRIIGRRFLSGVWQNFDIFLRCGLWYSFSIIILRWAECCLRRMRSV